MVNTYMGRQLTFAHHRPTEFYYINWLILVIFGVNLDLQKLHIYDSIKHLQLKILEICTSEMFEMILRQKPQGSGLTVCERFVSGL